MQRSVFSGEDPYANASRAADRAAERAAAIQEDSARVRATIAAGRDRRSIGVTRSPVRDDADEF